MAYFLWVIQKSRVPIQFFSQFEPSRLIDCLAHRVGPVRPWFVGSRNSNSKNLPSCRQREASIYGATFEGIWSNPAFISGIMLYFLLVVVEEYLDLQYRQILWTIGLYLVQYLNIQSLHFARAIQTLVLHFCCGRLPN